jgi:hypothetical protein
VLSTLLFLKEKAMDGQKFKVQVGKRGKKGPAFVAVGGKPGDVLMRVRAARDMGSITQGEEAECCSQLAAQMDESGIYHAFVV